MLFPGIGVGGFSGGSGPGLGKHRIMACFDTIYVSHDYGATWSATYTGSTNIGQSTQITVSETGQYVLFFAYTLGVRFSSDYGDTWTVLGTGTYQWKEGSISKSGQYITLMKNDNTLWVSTDYGQTLTNVATLSYGSNGYSLSISATGQYQIFCTGSGGSGYYVYKSSNYGATWGISSVYDGSWHYIGYTAISDSGQYMMLGSSNNVDVIWVSSNYGASWNKITAVTTTDYHFVAMSKTGQYMAALGLNYGYYWYSSDYGVTWNKHSLLYNKGQKTITMDESGQTHITTGQTGSVYQSDDYGVSFQNIIPQQVFYAFDMTKKIE
ncbi:MAG: hypothetical protein WAO52_02425 [Prolixibacteraceae bacterium]